MFKKLMLFGWRNIFRRKAFLLINVIGSAIGMTSAFFISIWVINEFSYDKFNPDYKSLYMVSWSSKDGTSRWAGSPYGLGEAAVQKIPGVSLSTRFMDAGLDKRIFHAGSGFYLAEHAAFVDSNWFKLIHYKVREGSLSGFADPGRGIVISESIARKYFGKQEAVGKTVLIDSTACLVQAVVEDPPTNSSFGFDILIPGELHYKTAGQAGSKKSWQIFDWYTLIRAGEKATRPLLQGRMQQLMADAAGGELKPCTLVRLDELHFDMDILIPGLPHGNQRTAFIFMSLGLLILIISCINYVNFVTAGVSLRAREIGVKKISGASRRSLFYQFLAESFFVNLLALLISILLVLGVLSYFDRFTGLHFRFDSFAVWIDLLIIFGITTLLTGVYPSVLLSSMRISLSADRSGFLKMRGAGLRKFLVGFQFIASICLIIGTLVIVDQLRFMRVNGQTFNRSEIVSVPLNRAALRRLDPQRKQDLINLLKNELMQNPGIEGITTGNESIINLQMSMTGIASSGGKKPGFDPVLFPLMVDQDFNSIFNLQLAEGRWFNAGSQEDRHNYILNQTAVETFGLRAPYAGQPFSVLGDTGKIIGVVRDFHFRDFHEKISPLVIMNKPGSGSIFFVKTKAPNARNAVSYIQKIWKKAFPEAPFEFEFLDESFNQLYHDELKSYALIGYFAFIAIFITGMGLYGLVTFTVQKKTKEIGIRKVLGASVRDIMLMLSREFVHLLLVASCVAIPVSWWAMNKWLQDFAYRISIGWWTFLFSLVLVFCVTLLVIGFRTFSSASVNPVDSLRSE